MTKNKKIILAICGKSAVGKDSLAKWLYKDLSRFNNVKLVISDTTRPPRENEIDGEAYHFISPDDFAIRYQNNYYLESDYYKKWFYGTPFNEIEEDAINIAVVSPAGLKKLMKFAIGFDFTVIPIYLQKNFYVRMQRSINREHKFKFEYLRRLFTDFFDFLGIKLILNNFRYKIIVPKDEIGVLRESIIVARYLDRHNFLGKNG